MTSAAVKDSPIRGRPPAAWAAGAAPLVVGLAIGVLLPGSLVSIVAAAEADLADHLML